MRFVVYGAGGIGGVIGARLFESGHDVVLIARGAHREAMEAHGLRIDSAAGSRTLPIPVATGPAQLDLTNTDVVLLAMKGQDTAGALEALASCAPADVAVVCAQNGVANERAALRMFPNVYGMCVMCPTGHLEPGVVEAYSSPVTGLLDIGRYPNGLDATAREVASALEASTFESEPREDIMRWKYQKLVMNLGNAVEAACGPAARGSDIARLALREALACFAAAGIDFASREEDLARRGNLLQMHDVGGRRRGGGSTWQSLARGTGTIETDYLNGEIVLLGRLHGVPTPVNAAIQRVAHELASSGAPPASMSVDELLAIVTAASSDVPA
ncbi:MAG TPA: 2-dehydropantoate 2-reductase N-terminal domain-containing protein [Acidimicrobiales bacterium]|jgi:2-dehydropantoate 2-reductase|nr:2-dehydropantoate 2-reductase N-terminal domain-containing protein [Acidimicrobiales bacterium]